MADRPAALGLGEVAELVGAYRWTEEQLFSLTGRWAADDAMTPEGQVRLFESSASHAWHARLWADRLPVLAGWDGRALTRPRGPVLGPLLEELGRAAGAVPRLTLLHRVVLPSLVATYRRHLDLAAPVADRPVVRVLRLVLADLGDELASAAPLVDRLLAREGSEAEATEAVRRLEGVLGEQDAGRSAAGHLLVPWPTTR